MDQRIINNSLMVRLSSSSTTTYFTFHWCMLPGCVRKYVFDCPNGVWNDASRHPLRDKD